MSLRVLWVENTGVRWPIGELSNTTVVAYRHTHVADSSGGALRARGFQAMRTGLDACAVSFGIDSGVEVSWTTEFTPDREKSRRTCWREFRRNTAE